MSERWDALDQRVLQLVQRFQKLREENRMLANQVGALEAELEAVRALRAERDTLRSEKEAVRRRVSEMLQQLDKLQV